MTATCVQMLTEPRPAPHLYHIIIADDDAFVRMLLKRIIERTCLSFIASIAENGQQALEIYNKYGADLLITDATMPGMDGIGLVRAVREEETELPIIMLSGDPEIQRKAYAAGVTVFLEKAPSLAQIENAITGLLPVPNRALTSQSR